MILSLLKSSNLFFVKNSSILKSSFFNNTSSVLKFTKTSSFRQYGKQSLFDSNLSQRRFNLRQRIRNEKNLMGFNNIENLKRNFHTGRLISQQVVEAEIPKAKLKPKYPVNSANLVGYWLLGISGLVFGIVVLGGLTRLTESGLSITEWKPITGAIPPITEEEWLKEFEKYKSSPEFKQLNSHIELDDYKFIFFMEWFHRLWGRSIGLALILPALYFTFSKKSSAHINRRFIGLTLLLGLQGAVGWWMVYSGLDQAQLDERNSKPTVSQYRLTTHLGAAFLFYAGLLHTGLEILRENKWIKSPRESVEIFKKLDSSLIKPFRRVSVGLLVLSFITAMSGGMVAGLDAGLIYNTFPKMSNNGEQWVPSNKELFSDVFCRKEDKSDLIWRNLFENPTTVQLVHRVLAITTFSAVFAAHMYFNRYKAILPRNSVRLMHFSMGMVTLQAALGISTLIYLVPIPLAASHQAGAVGLLTVIIALVGSLRRPRFPIRVLVKRLSEKMKAKPQ